MGSFEYVVKDPEGIHARPAGVIVAAAKEASSPVTITKGDKTIEAKKLLALMGLGIKNGETITVSCDDDAVLESFKKVLEENL